MIILLFVIFLIFTIGKVWYNRLHKSHDFVSDDFLPVFSGILACCAFIAILICTAELVELSVIDEKIAMYESENEYIESKIDDLVKNYMQYESDTLKSFSSESSMTLVTLYPDLKSDQLVQQQLETYTSNNKSIKALKIQKIENTKAKWWLYFGH